MKQKTKPKYSVGRNVGFMLGAAWRRQRSILFVCLAIALLSTGCSVVQLFLAPEILAKVEQAAPVEELVGTILLFSGGLFLLNACKRYMAENALFARVMLRTWILQAIQEKACVTSYPNTLDANVRELQENAINACSGNDQPAEYIWTTLVAILVNILGFFLYFALLSNLNRVLICMVLVTTVTGFFVNRYIQAWDYRHREEKAKYTRQMRYARRRSEDISLAKDIRIFGLKPWLNEIYEGALRLYRAFLNKRARIYMLAGAADVALSFARNGIAYFYLIRLALNGTLSASEFLLYFSAVSGFTEWVRGILLECSALHRESLQLSCIQEYLNLREPFRFDDGRPVPQADRWELELRNVSFRYPGSEKEILHNLSLTVHSGEKLAIVGLNGAGKTTLVKLLCGFYDPTEGAVLLNGTDIREFDRAAYYTLFSAVFQDFSTLDITVAESVAQTVTDIDRNRVSRCLEQAGLTEQIAAYPKGLDTHIGRSVYEDGVLLSGGQMQRLMLARALYKDGPILVLDEPTAALDPIAENDIYRKYHEMTAGKTSVFISHRLASTRFCDRIIFLKDGDIAEEGTHEVLLQQGGAYAALFAVQSRYYQEGRDFDGEE